MDTFLYYNCLHIEEKNPLKQGLKPLTAGSNDNDAYNWREESIKTRIETTVLAQAMNFF